MSKTTPLIADQDESVVIDTHESIGDDNGGMVEVEDDDGGFDEKEGLVSKTNKGGKNKNKKTGKKNKNASDALVYRFEPLTVHYFALGFLVVTSFFTLINCIEFTAACPTQTNLKPGVTVNFDSKAWTIHNLQCFSFVDWFNPDVSGSSTSFLTLFMLPPGFTAMFYAFYFLFILYMSIHLGFVALSEKNKKKVGMFGTWIKVAMFIQSQVVLFDLVAWGFILRAGTHLDNGKTSLCSQLASLDFSLCRFVGGELATAIFVLIVMMVAYKANKRVRMEWNRWMVVKNDNV